jgi:glycolate oxidase iron-sulfur subunit
LIPGINLYSLAGDCCGAAGTYMLTQTDTAMRLRADVLDGMKTVTTRYLVTANVGCAIHLANGLRQFNPDIEVIHPLTLLHRQLR